MIINNRLDTTFEPRMAVSGWMLLACGAVFFMNIMGWVLIVLGFILASARDGVLLDTGERRLKRYTGPFGQPLLGRWESLDIFTGLTLIPVKQYHSVRSRSNRLNSYPEEDFRIYLVDSHMKPAFAIAKSPEREDALKKMDALSKLLDIKVYRITGKQPVEPEGRQ